MGDFRRLAAWQKARALIKTVYTTTASFPKTELFGLTSQARRAAVSVAANIAEGRGKNSDKELGRYLGIALGSATELECLCVVANDLGMMSDRDSQSLVKDCQEVQAMMAVLRKSL